MIAAVNQESEYVPAGDMIAAGAVDASFYSRTWFPQTAKQISPKYHAELWDTIERPENRQVAIEAYRGSAKTSILRLFTSKRIAYAISRTILFISDTESHSVKSIEWLMKNIEYNRDWTSTFQLRKGRKWTNIELEILHGVEEIPIRVIALGITGQVRGINVDDFRPDLIVVDDPLNDENTATPEQREKIAKLFFGAVLRSLAPPTENPDATIAVLQTPLTREDLIETLMLDPTWVSRRYGCFTTDGTASRWPERFPLDWLLREKESYIARNRLSVWMREMECKITSPETSAFVIDWLQYWDILPEGCTYYMAIDPASSDNPKADKQACVVVGVKGPDVFLAEYTAQRGQDPDELAQDFVRLWLKYRPVRVIVETNAYQKFLAWYLEQVKRRHRIPAYITEYPPKGYGIPRDRRKKEDRIIQAIRDRAAMRTIWVHRSHFEFIQQYSEYPAVSHEDILDAFSMVLDMLDPTLFGSVPMGRTDSAEPLSDDWRSAP